MNAERSNPWAIAGTLALCIFIGGCATITVQTPQTVSVETEDKDGTAVAGAECKLNNDKGHWTVVTPATVIVQRSSTDLFITCQKEGSDPGTLVAISRANIGMVGNIVFGGVIGAVIDHTQGSAYDYPQVLRVVMGSTRTIDKAAEPTQTASPAPPAPAAQRPAAASPASPVTVSFEDLKDLLPAQ